MQTSIVFYHLKLRSLLNSMVHPRLTNLMILKARSHGHCNVHRMRIECALRSIHLGRWFGSGLKLDYIIIHDLREVMPTMRSLACSLARLFVACGVCFIATFCSALAAMLGKKEGCFLKTEKSGVAR